MFRTDITEKIIGSLGEEKFTHPYITTRVGGKKLLIAISPDRGLCGSLNTNLYKKLIEVEDNNTNAVTIGKKVGLFTSKLSFDLLFSFPMGSKLPDYSLVMQIKQIIDDEIAKGNATSVSIVYADFISLFTQTPIVKQLLPLEFEAKEETIEKNSSIYEPDKAALLNELLPYYLEVQIYNALLQAFTSEQAAQMVAMQNAKNNAFDIAEYLNLVYNKSRQERITNEILDLSNSTQV